MKQKINLTGDIIGLDLGKSRTGVARINTFAKIAQPLDDIKMDDRFIINVINVVNNNFACAVVAGLPRGLDGQNTQQTEWAKILTNEIEIGLQELNIPVFSIDEAGTTKQAEEKVHKGQSVDGVVAGILLEDFIKEVNLGKIDNVSI